MTLPRQALVGSDLRYNVWHYKGFSKKILILKRLSKVTLGKSSEAQYPHMGTKCLRNRLSGQIVGIEYVRS